MSELSYFWNGTAVGDAVLAPYTQDAVSEVVRMLFLYDNTKANVVGNMDNELAVANPSGTTITINTGWAVVDGNLYKNSALLSSSVTAPMAGTNYYRFILRKSWAAKTVTFVRLGPDPAAYPALTQTDGVTWDACLARVTITAAGAITILDDRYIIRSPGWQRLVSYFRDFRPAYSGMADHMVIQVGVVSGVSPLTVTFPVPFDNPAAAPSPCVVTMMNDTNPTSLTITEGSVDFVATFGDANAHTLYWMAIGRISP